MIVMKNGEQFKVLVESPLKLKKAPMVKERQEHLIRLKLQLQSLWNWSDKQRLEKTRTQRLK